MVTQATGMKLRDRSDSGFKWNGNKPSIGSGECQPQEQSVTAPVPLTDHKSQGQGHTHTHTPGSPGSECPNETSKQFGQQGREVLCMCGPGEGNKHPLTPS